MTPKSRASKLGYEELKPRLHVVMNLKAQEAEFRGLFSALTQWELTRFFKPQGPIPLKDIPWQNFRQWSNEKKTTQAVLESLEEWCLAAGIPSTSLPQATPHSFFKELATYMPSDAVEPEKAELEADQAGTLVYRATLTMANNDDIRFRLAPPVLGASSRLWRRYSTGRVVRVSVDALTLRSMQSRDKSGRRKRKAFKLWLTGQLLINGLYYRCFYQKESTLYFWAEDARIIGQGLKQLAVFLNELVPYNSGLNDGMSVAKYSARIKLWLSKTVEVGEIEKVRWMPDLTNHTLPISPEQMARISRRSNFNYVPTSIAGIVKGRWYTWRLDVNIAKAAIGVYAEMLEPSLLAALKCRCPRKDKAETHPVTAFSLGITFTEYLGFGRQRACAIVHIQEEGITPTLFQLEEKPLYDEAVMTDGCGIMSYALSRLISETQGSDSIPSAAQGRVEGAKGLWVPETDPDPEDEKCWIGIRPSQLKYLAPEKPSWKFDLIATSQASKSGSIGKQLNGLLTTAQLDAELLSENRKRMGELHIEEEEVISASLLHCKSRASLRANLEKYVREYAGQEEARGMREFGDEEKEDADLRGAEEEQVGIEPLSGRPCGLAARAIAMLDAGFSIDPMEPNLLQMIQWIDKGIRNANNTYMKTALPCSRHFFVMPDHMGVLEEGEIFCQMSGAANIEPKSKLRRSNILHGEVLLTRAPCVQPTDVQRCTAVYNHLYQDFHDVIICSTKGKQSVLSKLSGGDYDGDTVQVIYDLSLVKNWINADDRYIAPEFDVASYFEDTVHEVAGKRVESVADLRKELKRVKNKSVQLQGITTAGMFVEPMYGILAKSHAVLQAHPKYGPYHEQTVKCAHLYTIALDSAKAGKSFRYDWFQVEREFAPESDPRNGLAATAAKRIPPAVDLEKSAIPRSPPRATQPMNNPPATPPSSGSNGKPITPGGGITESLDKLSTADPRSSPTRTGKRAREKSNSSQTHLFDDTKPVTAISLSDPDLFSLWEKVTEEAATKLKEALEELPKVEWKAKYAKILSERVKAQQRVLLVTEEIEIWEKKQNWLSNLYSHIQEARNKYAAYCDNWKGYSADSATKAEILRKEKVLRHNLVKFYYGFLEWSGQDARPKSIDDSTARQIAASCAYWWAMDCGEIGDAKRVNGFPFIVAFRTLLYMKAEAVNRGEHGAYRIPEHIMVELRSCAKPSKPNPVIKQRTKQEQELAQHLGPKLMQTEVYESDEDIFTDAVERIGDLEDGMTISAVFESIDEFEGVWYEDDDEVFNDSGIGSSQEVVR